VASPLTERSAGGVIVIPLGPARYVALIELRGGSVLALPKGHIEAGESEAATAVREVREETGLRGEVVAPLPEITYSFYARQRRARVQKTVAFYLLSYRAGSPAHHDAEVDGVRLVPLERALEALSYEGERRVMAAATALLIGAGAPAVAAKSPRSDRSNRPRR
jgi:8-oxo-dGTP pyrophosphatase MutT (NUDIX family)